MVDNGRPVHPRLLAVAAAKHDLRVAQDAVVMRRTIVVEARAHVLAVQARAKMSVESAMDVLAAKREHSAAKRAVKAALAEVEARRAAIVAARNRANGPASKDPAAYPLAILITTHDQLTARWMEYETDVAKALAFPAMIDATSPFTAAFLDANRRAQWLRPRSLDQRLTVAEYVRLRDAVAAARVALDAAEAEAWRLARASVEPGRGRRPAESNTASARPSAQAQPQAQPSAPPQPQPQAQPPTGERFDVAPPPTPPRPRSSGTPNVPPASAKPLWAIPSRKNEA